MAFNKDKDGEPRELDVPTTNKVEVKPEPRRPIEPFDFKDMITTGNVEEVRKRNAADPKPKKPAPKKD